MNRQRQLIAACGALALSATASAALAQRAGEDALRSASDGFGLSMGNDSVGIYSTTSVRGFNPVQAGNVRIEGLYFDLAGPPQNRNIRSTSMHVGLGAQSYPFPAPTGVADNHLRYPSPTPIRTIALDLEHPHGIRDPALIIEWSGPVAKGLGVVGGITLLRNAFPTGGAAQAFGGGGVVDYRPSDDLQLNLFYGGSWRHGVETAPLIFTAGAFTPPPITRNRYVGQTWTKTTAYSFIGGGMARLRVSPHWEVRAGLFRSGDTASPGDYSIQFLNTQPDGAAQLDILGEPAKSTLSWSGEVRASGSYVTGPLKHVVHVSARGKDWVHLFGGADRRSFGAVNINVKTPIAEPAFNLGPRTRDEVRQWSVGGAYAAKWSDKAEFSLGAQKASYRRALDLPGQPRRNTSDAPWLYYATAAVSPAKPLIVFSSFTRGLEDSGVAPDNAVNRGEVMPASLTEQMDAGFRYMVSPRLTLVADVFQITKPYFALSAQNQFGPAGQTRHTGFEASVTSRPVAGLTLIGGLVMLKPRILHADALAIGKVPPGRPARTFKFNAQYGPPAWHGFSLNAAIDHQAGSYYDRLNILKLPATTRLDVGGRYDFKFHGAAVSLRAQVNNVTDSFRWQAAGDSNRVSANASRQYILRLAADY